jgi:hypothetical protein
VLHDGIQFLLVAGIYLFIAVVSPRLLSSENKWFFVEAKVSKEQSCPMFD